MRENVEGGKVGKGIATGVVRTFRSVSCWNSDALYHAVQSSLSSPASLASNFTFPGLAASR
jgi:hypothetical protein